MCHTPVSRQLVFIEQIDVSTRRLAIQDIRSFDGRTYG